MCGFRTETREITVPSDTLAIWLLTIAPLAEGITAVPAPQVQSNRASPLLVPIQTGRFNSPGFSRTELNPSPAAQIVHDDPPDAPGEPNATEGRDTTQNSVLVNGSVNDSAGSSVAQPASFGNNRPGRRSGFHGSVSALFGNSAFDARPFSLGAVRVTTPSYVDWRLNGTVGGLFRSPWLSPNRGSFFATVERARDDTISTQWLIVPSALARAGNFSQARDRVGQTVNIVDPVTGLPFPNGQIPADRITPQAVALLQYFPLPKAQEDERNQQTSVANASRRTTIQSRVTQPLSSRDQLLSTINYRNVNTDGENAFHLTDVNSSFALDSTVSWTHRFSRFSTLRASYRFATARIETLPHFAWRTNVSGDAGILGNNQEPRDWGPPVIQFSSGLTRLSSAEYALTRDRTHEWSAENIWNKGRHAVTVGGGSRAALFDLSSGPDARGTFSFTGVYSGNDLADFLLGLPHAIRLSLGNADKALRGAAVEAYVNDDWRVRQNLTMNLGLRWDYETPFTERGGQLVNLDLTEDFGAGALVTATDSTGRATARRYPTSLLFPDRRGIQPRVGVAWRPMAGSALVVRGGYGIYRVSNTYRPIALLMTDQPPFSRTVNAENDATNPVSMANGFSSGADSVLPTFAVDPDLRVGAAHTWQLSLQKDFLWSLTITAGYQGITGSHLMQESLPNTYPPGSIAPCPSCPLGFVYLQSAGRSVRHAFNVQLRRRLRDGLAATVQYRFARATDDSGTLSGPTLSGAAIGQDWQHREAEQSWSSFDQRHLLTANAVYSTGIGARAGGLAGGWQGRLLRGWTLAGDVTAGSGLPITPIYLRPLSGTAVVGTIRASVTGLPGRPPEGFYFDPSIFGPPEVAQWGTARRNSLRGPAQFNVNASLSRMFREVARMKIECRLDSTNVLNRVTYAGVDSVVGSPRLGLPISANPMRKLMMSVRIRF
jgi:hypothetical protein